MHPFPIRYRTQFDFCDNNNNNNNNKKIASNFSVHIGYNDVYMIKSNVLYCDWMNFILVEQLKCFHILVMGAGLRAPKIISAAKSSINFLGFTVKYCWEGRVVNDCMHRWVSPGWRQDNKTLSFILALCEGNPPVFGEFSSPGARNYELWFYRRR